jgi:hypothetical protein
LEFNASRKKRTGNGFTRIARIDTNSQEGGPLDEETGGHGTPEILAAKLQGLREIHLEQGLEAVGQGGALINDGAAVFDQLLEQARLAVLGLPGSQLIGVAIQEEGLEIGVGAVVLGFAGNEGLAEFFEQDGVDGIEGDPGIGFQEGDEGAGRLLQADGEVCGGLFLVQVQKPAMEFFRGTVQGLATGGTVGLVDDVQIDFAVGAVETGDELDGLLG